jgi:hypothetical protein
MGILFSGIVKKYSPVYICITTHKNSRIQNELSLDRIHLADTEISIKLERYQTRIHLMIYREQSLIIDKMANPGEIISVSF